MKLAFRKQSLTNGYKIRVSDTPKKSVRTC